MNLINFNRRPQRMAWNNLVDEVFQAGFKNPQQATSRPAVNIREQDNNYSIELIAPGLKKEDFEIKVEKDQLLISVNKEEVKQEKTEKYARKEFSTSNFKRSFHLTEKLDADNIKAGYEAGILTVEVPKKEVEVIKPKVIAVS